MLLAIDSKPFNQFATRCLPWSSSHRIENAGQTTAVTDDLALRSRLAHRYLEDFIREHYPHIVYDDGQVLLLSKGS